jgi:NADPH-dependent 2,4-dienoyl-CoA reductase/sulfur reductase-like enzyme/rhodanese-related sulfurtransferase
MSLERKRLLIVGGVAGGASCAARARRLSETAEIIIFERGPFVSFANCGLPYYVGDVIQDERKLLVANADLFQQRFNIQVRLENEVMAIAPEQRSITVRDRRTGDEYQESYDALVLAPGASPIRPPIPGIDRPGIFAIRTIPDSRRIRDWIQTHQVQQAVVVGAGFIGLEMAENLIKRGIAVTLIEGQPQIMPPFDPEMTAAMQDQIQSHGVTLRLSDSVVGFEDSNGRLRVTTQSGDRHSADLVILGIGVRPESALAKAAGLELGQRGSIRVNEKMQTSDPHIWAVGDVVEVQDVVTGERELIPLAGPANRQGRVAADTIFGRSSQFRGVQGTSVCGAFGLTLACTGASEKTLKRLGWAYDKVYLHPGHHVSYYPNAHAIDMKLLFSIEDGRILGAQAVGEAGAEKRIDVISMAIQTGATVFDLEEAELCYAPQFGAAKDPVNMAGMIAANALRGDAPLRHWQDSELSGYLLDVREIGEFETGHVESAVNIPLSQLRDRMGELPKNKPILVYCQVGQRAYYATRALRLDGYDAYNVSGGIQTYRAIQTVPGNNVV